ncbi:hypothetical protein BEWA_019490 [Theileria equi strain WA]|uniref:non-specific serine/threonine protein kinase n=1 Tax=Theileria equi strain WA TaxID=1537102 RepID=L0AW30_THEEQ|nr:hypothetical protein BEWA_019490 [Theileria equi strain WA]AFZ79104.1 hypothetical protein BEWA_019490 [Theileria equi strain WA]|eukprot:XP_004828770.1 hypothetical protein BEWA_019490 [Theileria equi strain WA]
MYEENGSHIIAQGAEAVVLTSEYLGKPCVIKRRLPKRFRHKVLDEQLTKNRITAECRSIQKLRKAGVFVPVIYLVNFIKKEIIYEYINGSSILSLLNTDYDENLLSSIGETIAKMHNSNIVHGDLTTKNMMMAESGEICLIDFGLSFSSTLAEDKAVDLYVLERCCTPSQFEIMLKGYFSTINNQSAIRGKLEEVRLRGRKRDLSG